MFQCKTNLCSGTVKLLESWKHTLYNRIAAAECPECKATYWLYERDGQITHSNRELPDQRNSERNELCPQPSH